ncbi:MAG: threonine synthase [Candidatus Aminicenantes bacterium]|nr:MAG: threonine synthase [Candidatus Aminicenantes bacterium]
MEFLECLFCQKKYPLDLFDSFCPDCREPMLYPSPPKKRRFYPGKNYPLERFLDFLPLSKLDASLNLGEGNTPLVKLNRLIERTSLPNVFAKNETFNPTYSFKDRGSAVAFQKAVAMGLERIGTVSTGNMASSTAAYGAKAGLKTFVLLKEDTSLEKTLSVGIHNPELIRVKGDYGELFTKSFSIGRKYNIYFMNSVDPFRVEGYKATGFEIFFQLNHRAPQFIFVPLSSGGHLMGLMRAFLDLKKEGFIQQVPIFVGVQAQGCAPLAKAFASGKSKFERIKKAETIAHAISNPDPAGGNISLRMIKENNGMILDVSDEEIIEAQKMLAELEGIFCQPASATTLAGLLKFSKNVKFKTRVNIVLVITGSGLKALKSIESSRINVHQASLSDLENTIGSILK